MALIQAVFTSLLKTFFMSSASLGTNLTACAAVSLGGLILH